jgi:hypothetical protein
VALELPPADDCIRLLRDPFTSRATAPVRLSSATRIQSFFFSADGTRLILVRADGSVAAQALPHSPRSTVPKPRRFHPPLGHRLVAAGWRRNGGLLVLTRSDKVLWIHGGLKGALGTSRPLGIPYLGYEGLLPDAPPLDHPPGLATALVENGRERVLALDREGHLFVVSQQGPALLANRVSALAEVRRKLVFVMTPSGDSTLEGVWLGLLEDSHQRHLPLGPGEGEARFGYAASIGHTEAGLLAVRQQLGVWRLHLAQGQIALNMPVDSQVVGTAAHFHRDEDPGLLVLGPDRRTFMLMTATGGHSVARAADEVVQAAASQGLPVLAWLTVKGELVVWNLPQRVALYRAAPEEGT